MAEKDMRRFRFASLAAAMCLAGALAPHAAASPEPDGPAAPLVASESEPNDTPGNANVLGFSGPLAIVRGAIAPAGDPGAALPRGAIEVDYYVFRAPAGYKVWVLVDTGGVQAANGTSRDSLVTLFGSDGTTVIEEDDDDGVGTGGDASVETIDSSAIAGRTLTAAGVYYLRVTSAGTIDPYRLYVLLTPGTYPAETEPNDAPGFAEPLLLGSNSFAARTAVATEFNVDYFAVKARAGDILFVGVDADPERDGFTSLVAEVFAPDGTTLLSSGAVGLTGGAVSLAYVVPSSGTYYVRVYMGANLNDETYHIAVALSGAVQGSLTTIRSAIGSDTLDYPSFHGSLSDRPFRDLGVSICGLPGPCTPPVAGGPFLYDAYPFFNFTDNTACITVDFDAMTCDASGGLFAVAYLGAFDPTNLCFGYAGDLGILPDPQGRFSFEVPPATPFVIVVSEAAPATLCPAYTLRVSGLCDGVGLVVDEHVGPGASNLNGVLEVGELVQVEAAWINSQGDLYQAFEAVTPPALPVGWVAVLVQGEVGDATWTTVSTSAHSPPNSAFVPAPGHVTDNWLLTPLVTPAPLSTLLVRHAFDFEDSHDGGVIEISINGGPYVDIVAAGGNIFLGQDYNRTIMAATGSPIAGRDAFSGSSGGYVSSFINMPLSAIGQPVRFVFRAASDSVGASAGWNVDSILLRIDGSELFGRAAFTGPAGPVYGNHGSFAAYGAVLSGDISGCYEATDSCYGVSVTGNRPATHWDAIMQEDLTTGQYRRWPVHVGGSFNDVPTGHLFYRFVETILHNGVTAGGFCGGYCPNASVLRKQMAVFVLKARFGAGYIPPPATGDFVDVPPTDPFAPWIEDLYQRGVVAGCGPGPAYCPDAPVLRQQMPVFLLRTLLGSGYAPPACSGLFGDVPCLNPFAPWIEEAYRRGIAAGCSVGLYCPANATTRGQMSPFLVKTFGLVLYGP